MKPSCLNARLTITDLTSSMCTDMCHGSRAQCIHMETYDSQAKTRKEVTSGASHGASKSTRGRTDGTTTAPYMSRRPALETNTQPKHAPNMPANESSPRAQTDNMPNPPACAHDRPAVWINNNRCEPRHQLRQKPNPNPNPQHTKLGILLLTESASR